MNILAKICKNCGSKIDDEAVFCAKCGKKIAVSGALPVLSDNNKSKSLGPDYATRDEALSWWNWRGRLNRQRFILRSLILTTIAIVVGIILCGGISFFITTTVMSGQNEDAAFGIMFLLLLCALPFILPLTLLSFFLLIKRGHDLNIPGWVVVIVSLLGASFFLSIYLAVAKGNEGPNQYGENPLKYPGSI